MQPVYRRTNVIRRRVRKDEAEEEKCASVAQLLLKGKSGVALESEIKNKIRRGPGSSSGSSKREKYVGRVLTYCTMLMESDPGRDVVVPPLSCPKALFELCGLKQGNSLSMARATGPMPRAGDHSRRLILARLTKTAIAVPLAWRMTRQIAPTKRNSMPGCSNPTTFPLQAKRWLTVTLISRTGVSISRG